MDKVNFNEFQQVMTIIVNIDNVDRSLILEYMNEWYDLYKTTNQKSPAKWGVVEWAQQQFQDVSPATHDFWIDWRGLCIFELQSKVDNINVSTIFPVCK